MSSYTDKNAASSESLSQWSQAQKAGLPISGRKNYLPLATMLNKRKLQPMGRLCVLDSEQQHGLSLNISGPAPSVRVKMSPEDFIPGSLQSSKPSESPRLGPETL